MRIAVVTVHPTPYRDPFWNHVAAEPGVSLDVYYCTNEQGDLPWQPTWEIHYHAEALPVINLAAKLGRPGFIYWNPSIRDRLARGHYDAVVISGYNHPTMLEAIRFCRWNRVPYFLMSESYLAQPRAHWRRLVKTPLVRWVVRGAEGCFPTGRWAKEYLVHYGADPARCWFVPNVPDVDALASRADRLTADRAGLKARLGLGADPVVLYVGRLVPFKRVDILLEAFARTVNRIPSSLAIVGDGILRGELEAQAASLGLTDRVHFVGFTPPEDVADWYAAADVLVLPSVGETWSTTLIEALASDLPVITTSLVGAAADVINDSAVGTIVPPADSQALESALAHALQLPRARADIRRLWSDVRETLRYTALAQRFVAAVRTCLAASPAA